MNFSEAVISAVTSHMNGDHAQDNLLIARAFGFSEASECMMVNLDGGRGVWRVKDSLGEHELVLDWPGGRVSDRSEIRREIVALCDAACEKLGVTRSKGHAVSEVSGGVDGQQLFTPETEHHGVFAAGTGTEGFEEAEDAVGFSRVVREGSWSEHSDSEGAAFMERILGGTGTLQDYINLVAQHFFVYEALEEVAVQLAADASFAVLHPAALTRMPAICADLEYLVGSDWRQRISPVPSAVAYAARIREVGGQGWIAGIVAHHYTRYLGDLSGGQVIAQRLSAQHNFGRAGVEFYNFAELGSPSVFKKSYRQGLDRLGELLDDEQKDRMLDEVRRAYGFNTAVFVDLERERSVS